MIGNLFVFCITLCFLGQVCAKNSCMNQLYLNSIHKEKIKTTNFLTKDCSEIYFIENEKLNSHLGSLTVKVFPYRGRLSLNISFLDVKWTKAFLRLTEIEDTGKTICKKYTIGNEIQIPVKEVYDECFNFNNCKTTNYVLEFKAELNTDTLYKKIIFRLPVQNGFDNSVSLPKRAIFMSIDCSSNYRIILKIQSLPSFYNITYYKVEVFRENSEHNILLDVRMLEANDQDEISFEYVTYNDEGLYFFRVSPINSICPEEKCLKSESPKIYIKRKYPPLVIGIVGASFLIPFVLFIFHMWTRRNQSLDELEERKDKLYIVYSQTPQKHYLVVKSFEKTLKSLTKVEIVKDITQATHILYVCGAHVFEPDPTVYKYLVTKLSKSPADLDIFVIMLPYSVRDISPYLRNCLRFEFMDDFGKLINIFNCEVEDVSTDPNYNELIKNIKIAQVQTEPAKILLNMPIIIVTEQSDGSDAEPKEGDGLL